MAKYTITESFIRAKIIEGTDRNVIFYDDHAKAPKGFGLRVTPNGAAAFVINYFVDGKERRITVGPHPGLSITAARERAHKLKAEVALGGDPLADKERKREEKVERAQRAQKVATQTLGALLLAYADHLEAQGKVSAGNVRDVAENHVMRAHAELWATPAADIQPDDGVTILAPLVQAGKARSAGKLRSYLRAAYSAAVRARLDASAPQSLRVLGLRSNPMAELPTVDGGTGGTRERALSIAELRSYWRRIEAMNGADGALLRLHLLTGGQRVQQLARVTVADYDRDAKAIRLRDPKGKREKPRIHIVPLIESAQDALETLRGKGDYLFSIDGGKTPAGYDVLHNRLCPVVTAMQDAGEIESRFTIGDLRRTVETRLAALGVSREIRGQLQSHGLGGVQVRHYDKHDYLDEKRAALEALHRLVTGTDASVTPIKRKA
ncbi:MAG: integrase family protein [Rudaea sp.]